MSPAGRKALLLRIESALWRDLERWSADELRSVNGQIEFLLREAVRRRKRAAEEGAGAAHAPGRH